MNRRKGLTKEEIIKLVNEPDSSDELDDSDIDREYVPSSSDSDSCEELRENAGTSRAPKRKLSCLQHLSEPSVDSDSDDFSPDEAEQVSKYKCKAKNKHKKKLFQNLLILSFGQMLVQILSHGSMYLKTVQLQYWPKSTDPLMN